MILTKLLSWDQQQLVTNYRRHDGIRTRMRRQQGSSVALLSTVVPTTPMTQEIMLAS